MMILILTILLAVAFFVIGFMLRNCPIAERTIKATKPLSIMIDLSPLIGIIVFSILFTCVLNGRLPERISHAITVFGLWMCATKFYCYILAHFKTRWALISCLMGMLYSIGLAIFLSRLDRYVATLYSFADWYSLLLGCGLLLVYYSVTIISVINHGRQKGKAIND